MVEARETPSSSTRSARDTRARAHLPHSPTPPQSRHFATQVVAHHHNALPRLHAPPLPNPSAPLKMMLFNSSEDVIVIKSESDGSVMDASFKIPLNKKTASESPIPALMLRSAKEMEEKKRFKCRISSNLLRNIADTANSIDSSEVRFDLFSGLKDGDENITKHKLSVLFNGESNRIQGEHNFYINTIVRRVRGHSTFSRPLFLLSLLPLTTKISPTEKNHGRCCANGTSGK